MFFGLLALTMLGVKYKSDKRDRYLQHGGWFVKIALWLLFNALPFFFPIGLVNAYGKARFQYDIPRFVMRQQQACPHLF
jgi:phosphotransferase system  glucose/maltose/N-acetylglucosamine-specific IIC component